MSWLFVTRRRYNRELAAVRADRERIRDERTQFAEDNAAQHTATRTAARLYAEADAANRRLSDRVKVLTDRLNAVGSDIVLEAAIVYKTAYWAAHGKALWLQVEVAEAKVRLTDTQTELEAARTAIGVLQNELQAAAPPVPPSAKALREKERADRLVKRIDELTTANQALEKELLAERLDKPGGDVVNPDPQQVIGAAILIYSIIGARIIATAWHTDREAREQLPVSGRHRAPKKGYRRG